MKQKSFLSDVTKFTHAVGHDIKQPLGLIRAYSYYIKKTSKSALPELHQYTDKIDHQVDVVTQMLNKVVDSCLLSSGDIAYKIEPQNGQELLNSALKIVSDLYPTAKFEVSAQPLNVLADKLYLPVAISGILENAVLFSTGPVKVNLTQNEKNFQISVTDQGIGIAEKDLPHIFEAYFRGSNTKEANVKGMGLGLFIAHQIITAHDGSIVVHSALKSGSSFTVNVPI